jgi:hypothetical protein
MKPQGDLPQSCTPDALPPSPSLFLSSLHLIPEDFVVYLMEMRGALSPFCLFFGREDLIA